MATSSSHPSSRPNQPEGNESYTQMGPMDMDGVGAHCHLCRQQDFLPYQCQSCRHKFCGEHRTEDAHYCEKKGAWREAQLKKTQAQRSMLDVANGRPTVYNSEQCSETKCKSLFEPKSPSSHCDRCNRKYCWAHRMPEDHDCKNLVPIGARQGFGASLPTKSSIMDRLRKSMKDSKINVTAAKISMPVSAAKADKKKEFVTINKLKTDARQTGDAKISEEKRIYVFLLGTTDSAPEKWPRAKTFYSTEWTCGRILDSAAKSLKIPNKNNQTSDDSQKLGIFHYGKWGQSGKVLTFSKSLVDQGVTTGDTLVLYKGAAGPPIDAVMTQVEL